MADDQGLDLIPEDNNPLEVIFNSPDSTYNIGQVSITVEGSKVTRDVLEEFPQLRDVVVPIAQIIEQSFGKIARYVRIELRDVDLQDGFSHGNARVVLKVDLADAEIDTIIRDVPNAIGSNQISETVRRHLIVGSPVSHLIREALDRPLSSTEKMQRFVDEAGLTDNQKIVRRALNAINDASAGVLLNDYLVVVKGTPSHELTAAEITDLRSGVVTIPLEFEFIRMNQDIVREFVSTAVGLTEAGFSTYGIMPISVLSETGEMTIMSLISRGIRRKDDFLELGMDLDHLELVLNTIADLDRAGFEIGYFSPEMISLYTAPDGSVRAFIEISPLEDTIGLKPHAVDIEQVLNRRVDDLREWLRQIEQTALKANVSVEDYFDGISRIFESIIGRTRNIIDGFNNDFINQILTDDPAERRAGLKRLREEAMSTLTELGVLNNGSEVSGWQAEFDAHFARFASLFLTALKREDKKVYRVIPDFKTANDDEVNWQIVRGKVRDEGVETISEDIENIQYRVQRVERTQSTASIEVIAEKSSLADEIIERVLHDLTALRASVQYAMIKIKLKREA